MRRFLFAVGLAATVAVSEADAGYIVLRILLEGSGGAGGAEGPGGPARPVPVRPAVGPDGQPVAGEAHADPTRSVLVVVPYTNDITKPHQFYPKDVRGPNPLWTGGPSVQTQYGKANLLIDNTRFQLYTDLGPQAPRGTMTRKKEIEARHARWVKSSAEGQRLLDIVTDALEAGLVADAVKYADELLAATQAKDKKLQTTRQVEAFARAYAQVQKPVAARARAAGHGQALRQRLDAAYPGANDQSSEHYYLIYWDALPGERTRRLAQLEDNFRAYYLANAVRGVALPVPERPLVAVLAKSGHEVSRLAASVDGLPRVADGFYAPETDAVVLSPERLDPLGQTLRRQAQHYYQKGASRETLLSGRGPGLYIDHKGFPPGTVGPGGFPPGGQPGFPPGAGGQPGDKDKNQPPKDKMKTEDVARMMTWALTDRIAEDEAEWSGVSREGGRQLLLASGVLPRHVVLPLWLSEGSANYLHRPRGPVFWTDDDDKAHATVALATGYGGPNFVRQKQYAELVRLKQLNADPGQTVRNVLADAYFAAARTEIDPDDPKLPLPPKPKKSATPGTTPVPGERPVPGPTPGGVPGLPQFQGPTEDPATARRRKAEFQATKAQATAWAFYFYLVRNEAERLDRYFAELKNLPRDLPLDEATRLGVFARVFDLTNPAAYTALGSRWQEWMATVPMAGVDIALHEPSPDDEKKPAGQPGFPGFKADY